MLPFLRLLLRRRLQWPLSCNDLTGGGWGADNTDSSCCTIFCISCETMANNSAATVFVWHEPGTKFGIIPLKMTSTCYNYDMGYSSKYCIKTICVGCLISCKCHTFVSQFCNKTKRIPYICLFIQLPAVIAAFIHSNFYYTQ